MPIAKELPGEFLHHLICFFVSGEVIRILTPMMSFFTNILGVLKMKENSLPFQQVFSSTSNKLIYILWYPSNKYCSCSSKMTTFFSFRYKRRRMHESLWTLLQTWGYMKIYISNSEGNGNMVWDLASCTVNLLRTVINSSATPKLPINFRELHCTKMDEVRVEPNFNDPDLLDALVPKQFWISWNLDTIQVWSFFLFPVYLLSDTNSSLMLSKITIFSVFLNNNGFLKFVGDFSSEKETWREKTSSFIIRILILRPQGFWE